MARALDTSNAPLFVPPGHHYSPIVNTAHARAHFARLAATAVPCKLPGIATDVAAMRRLWSELLPYFQAMPFTHERRPGMRFAFDNPSFSWADASVLHAMLRLLRPRTYIEIGCGWSSACALDTIELNLDAQCEVILIDPFPELAHELLGASQAPLTVLGCPVQEVPLELFALLEAGDILFIDSTHVLRTGSDVCFELFELLPRLAPGVVVHVHDVFWPFEYPEAWAVDENRSWNELYALRALLTNNHEWEILFFNDYFARHERALVQATYPAFLRNTGGSLWLRRR
ncbi:class I SAM-dependent methyltransferase [Variovorax sp. EL159]|uniref:class I SAM-dependent methyltransferase n=1 Tax=Variovorax sp. EL159 TaxID=1566270 RepID=UPI00088970B4|nr:class I SAM-dependent methyltransferase [Variovorax sp. EL159]SCX59346.1 Methyltransferase domain-containing protein [Variovorax sp. EL159]